MRAIKQIAKQKRMPVSHVADRAGVSRSHFFAVMSGERSPTLLWVEKVADALEIDGADLLAKPQRTTR